MILKLLFWICTIKRYNNVDVYILKTGSMHENIETIDKYLDDFLHNNNL